MIALFFTCKLGQAPTYGMRTQFVMLLFKIAVNEASDWLGITGIILQKPKVIHVL